MPLPGGIVYVVPALGEHAGGRAVLPRLVLPQQGPAVALEATRVHGKATAGLRLPELPAVSAEESRRGRAQNNFSQLATHPCGPQRAGKQRHRHS